MRERLVLVHLRAGSTTDTCVSTVHISCIAAVVVLVIVAIVLLLLLLLLSGVCVFFFLPVDIQHTPCPC